MLCKFTFNLYDMKNNYFNLSFQNRMGCTLHQHGHSHGGGGGHNHGHSHAPSRSNAHVSVGETNRNFTSGDVEQADEGSQDSVETGSDESSCSTSSHVAVKAQNINVRAAYIHVLGDFLQSVGVFAAALVIYFEVRVKRLNIKKILLIIKFFFLA
jgi:Co/Zn/Cd efflux system component